MATAEYEKKDWKTGEVITEEALDNMENGIAVAIESVRSLEKQVTEGKILVSFEDAQGLQNGQLGISLQSNDTRVVQGTSYRISKETFSASKSDCSAKAVSPGNDVLPIIVGDLIEDATGAVWQVAAVADGTFKVGEAPVRQAPTA